jgi:hypothetical protein
VSFVSRSTWLGDVLRQGPSETSQDVDEKVEQVVFWIEEFRANQSLQVEILWEQTAVVKYAAHRRYSKVSILCLMSFGKFCF